MKIALAILAFTIFCSTATRLSTLDFLNDPFFKQLAAELDTMFAAEDGPTKPAAHPAKQKEVSQPSSKSDASLLSKPVVADSTKDLKTLFLETLGGEATKEPTTKAFGKPAAAPTLPISKKRVKAYHHYMDTFVEKIRLIERCIASNPGRTFGPKFLVAFDKIIDSIDQIEETQHLLVSKKLYMRAFFSQPMQKTRELIVSLQPKLEATLHKLEPLLKKEEMLDGDIKRLHQEAGPSRFAPTHTLPATPALTRKRNVPAQQTTPKQSKGAPIPRFNGKGAL